MRHTAKKPSLLQPGVKPVVWCGSALLEVRAFPDEARREGGFQLGKLQKGKEADDWKPISMVGPGTIEIRIQTGSQHRVFVVTKFAECIYVLHAFEKKSQKIPQRNMELAKRRYRELMQMEQRR